ncbi:hypothetical protein Pfo_027330 [Paulownia fortunei]|nr:hypothetical protein Pfo_027330 [Paulownia fortunei]
MKKNVGIKSPDNGMKTSSEAPEGLFHTPTTSLGGTKVVGGSFDDIGKTHQTWDKHDSEYEPNSSTNSDGSLVPNVNDESTDSFSKPVMGGSHFEISKAYSSMFYTNVGIMDVGGTAAIAHVDKVATVDK